MTTAASTPAPHGDTGSNPATYGLLGIVGFLAAVEIASGILQGFYTPIFPQIARHLDIKDADVNWFEAAQLVVSALCLPVLSKLGDLIGHRRVLLLSTAITLVASWGIAFAPSFGWFCLAWAIQGFYIVWLPMEISLIHRRTAASGRQALLTRRSAAILVVFLEVGVIAGALVAGAVVESMSMTAVLALPAAGVTLALVAIWFGVPDLPPEHTGRLDWGGAGLITLAISVLMGGLILLRLQGPTDPIAWGVVALGLGAFVPFVLFELRQTEPLVDLRLLASPGQWPIQLTAFFLGMSVLGAQIPLSTYVQTDPADVGYGLGAGPGFVSTLIALYVVTLLLGASSLPLAVRIFGPLGALVVGALLIGLGYGLWLPFHSSLGAAMLNMALAGIGSGLLVAALPAAAAEAAPPESTGFVTGMTNGTKTLGGAIASAMFAIALASTGTIEATASVHAPLSGYLIVWGICSGSALLGAAALAFVGQRRRRLTVQT